MKETKGIVLKITDQFMVVMCDDGKFRNLPLPQKVPGVGERITVPLQQRQKKKKVQTWWLTAVAACFLVVLGFSVWAQVQPDYDSVIAIDINPSLELFVDAEGNVVKTSPLNADAQKVLDTFPEGKGTITAALEYVLTESMALGYIRHDKENTIMISVAHLKGESAISTDAIEAIVTETMKSKQMQGYLKVTQTDKTAYDEAKGKSISLNTVVLLQEMEQLGLPYPLEQPTLRSIEQFLHEAGRFKELFFVPLLLPTLKQNILEENNISQESTNRAEEQQQQENTLAPSPSNQTSGVEDTSPTQAQSPGMRRDTWQGPVQEQFNSRVPTSTSKDSKKSGARSTLRDADDLEDRSTSSDSNKQEDLKSSRDSAETEPADTFRDSAESELEDAFDHPTESEPADASDHPAESESGNASREPVESESEETSEDPVESESEDASRDSVESEPSSSETPLTDESSSSADQDPGSYDSSSPESVDAQSSVSEPPSSNGNR